MPQFEARTPTWTTRYPLAVNWWLLPGTYGGGRRCGQRRSWRRRSRPVEIPTENTAASIREPMRHGSCRDGFNFPAMSIKGDETPGPGWPGPELFDECLRRDLADDELVIRPGIEQNPPDENRTGWCANRIFICILRCSDHLPTTTMRARRLGGARHRSPAAGSNSVRARSIRGWSSPLAPARLGPVR